MSAIITIRNLQKKIPIDRQKIKKAVLKTLSIKKTLKKAQITLCFLNDSALRKLNMRFLRKNTATDVLAFDLSSPGQRDELVLEVAVSAQSAERSSQLYRTSSQYELLLYCVHGVLHALGYNDSTRSGRKQMQQKAEEILDNLTI